MCCDQHVKREIESLYKETFNFEEKGRRATVTPYALRILTKKTLIQIDTQVDLRSLSESFSSGEIPVIVLLHICIFGNFYR